jgi:hypothetical protein
MGFVSGEEITPAASPSHCHGVKTFTPEKPEK